MIKRWTCLTQNKSWI